MSNHIGASLLNEVIQLMDRKKAFARLGKQKTRLLIQQMLKIADRYDCHLSEVMEGVAKRVGICRWCGKPADDFDDKFEECPACRSS